MAVCIYQRFSPRLLDFLPLQCMSAELYILPEALNANRERPIEHYFNLGLSYAEILCFLVAVHGIHISLRQLKRVLQQLGLRRRANSDSINEVIANI